MLLMLNGLQTSLVSASAGTNPLLTSTIIIAVVWVICTNASFYPYQSPIHEIYPAIYHIRTIKFRITAERTCPGSTQCFFNCVISVGQIMTVGITDFKWSGSVIPTSIICLMCLNAARNNKDNKGDEESSHYNQYNFVV